MKTTPPPVIYTYGCTVMMSHIESGWGCDTTPPRCTHRVRVRCCEDDTPLQVWNSLFLPHICWKNQNCCWKTTRRCLSLLLFFRKSNADCRAHRLRRCSSLYNSLTKILPNTKWGNVAPLTFITGFFPTITSDQLSISLLLFPSVAQAFSFNWK